MEDKGIILFAPLFRYPQTISLCLNFFLRLISYRTEFKSIFREVGVLTMLINALKSYADDLQDTHELTGRKYHHTNVMHDGVELDI